MRVGQLRIERQGFAIRDDGVALSIQILQQDREVENQQGLRLVGRSVNAFRFLETAGDVQQPP